MNILLKTGQIIKKINEREVECIINIMTSNNRGIFISRSKESVIMVIDTSQISLIYDEKYTTIFNDLKHYDENKLIYNQTKSEFIKK